MAEGETQPITPIGNVSAEVAQGLAMQGVLKCVSKGKVSRFNLASKVAKIKSQKGLWKHAAQFGQGLIAADTDARKFSFSGPVDTPLAVLASRRDKSSKAFLSPALVTAGQRLRKDFEIGRFARCDYGTWDHCRLEASPEAALSKDARQREAVTRVAAALRELGSG